MYNKLLESTQLVNKEKSLKESISVEEQGGQTEIIIDGRKYITIYKPVKRGTSRFPGGINWSALGTVDVDTTEKFIEGLRKAIEVAEKYKYEANESKVNEEDNYMFEVGQEVGYHGRSGTVRELPSLKDSGHVIVYFSDVDKEEAIDVDELIQQNESKVEEAKSFKCSRCGKEKELKYLSKSKGKENYCRSCEINKEEK